MGGGRKPELRLLREIAPLLGSRSRSTAAFGSILPVSAESSKSLASPSLLHDPAELSSPLESFCRGDASLGQREGTPLFEARASFHAPQHWGGTGEALGRHCDAAALRHWRCEDGVPGTLGSWRGEYGLPRIGAAKHSLAQVRHAAGLASSSVVLDLDGAEEEEEGRREGKRRVGGGGGGGAEERDSWDRERRDRGRAKDTAHLQRSEPQRVVSSQTLPLQQQQQQEAKVKKSEAVALPQQGDRTVTLSQLAALMGEPLDTVWQAGVSLGILEEPGPKRRGSQTHATTSTMGTGGSDSQKGRVTVLVDMAELIALELERDVIRTADWADPSSATSAATSASSPLPNAKGPSTTASVRDDPEQQRSSGDAPVKGRTRATADVAGANADVAGERVDAGGATWRPRAPVVTVMGHVDHGKTSLLDALRSTSVAAREAGGITQHIGAFVVSLQSQAGASLTFLDTPGHAAFSSMRARGAAVTDIVVLVVAADDGVMPQTIESIQHAKEAGVAMVVALTKCDKPEANPSRVEQQLLAAGVELESAGGDVQVVQVSSKTKAGLEELEERLLLQAELMELRGRVQGHVEGVVVEAKVSRGQGPVATVIVKGGELKTGCCVVVGQQWGKVRSVKDWSGKSVKSAGPSIPVEIDGLKGLPEAGDLLVQVSSEEKARKLSLARQQQAHQQRIQLAGPGTGAGAATSSSDAGEGILGGRSSRGAGGGKGSRQRGKGAAAAARRDLEGGDKQGEGEEGDSGSGRGRGGFSKEDRGQEGACLDSDGEGVLSDAGPAKEVLLIVKGDVQGSVEAVRCAVENLSCSQVHVRVVHASAGPISQSDIDLADATGAAAVLGFNVRPMSNSVEASAKTAGVEMRLHRIIYRLLEDVASLVIAAAPGTKHKVVSGQAQVLQLFELRLGRRDSQVAPQAIAGCRVVSGKVAKGGVARVLRRGDVVFEGVCATLRREKSDVESVEGPTECGLTIAGWDSFVVGDVVEFLTEEVRKPRLVSLPNGNMYID